MERNYDLIIIDDGEVPMAPGIGHANYFFVMLAILVAVAVVVFLVTWYSRRGKMKKRLLELWGAQSKEGKVPFTIHSISGLIAEAEAELAATMI